MQAREDEPTDALEGARYRRPLGVEEVGTAHPTKLATDSGYHKNETLARCAAWGIRTYMSEKDASQQRVWTDKPAEQEQAFRNNRRRRHGRRGRRLQRLRRVLCERSFAHTCETGAGRRSWLRGLANVAKRYVIHAAAHNLGVILRKLFGVGTPRSLQDRAAAACAAYCAACATCCRFANGLFRELVSHPAPIHTRIRRSTRGMTKTPQRAAA